jgi:hypothetical protein
MIGPEMRYVPIKQRRAFPSRVKLTHHLLLAH